MFNYKDVLQPEIVEILENNKTKEELFLNDLKNYAKAAERAVVYNEIREFVSTTNTYISEKFPFVNNKVINHENNSFIINGKNVFEFRKDEDITIGYLRFLEQKQAIIGLAKSVFREYELKLEAMEDLIKKVHIAIENTDYITKNPYYHKVKPFSLQARYDVEKEKIKLVIDIIHKEKTAHSIEVKDFKLNLSEEKEEELIDSIVLSIHYPFISNFEKADRGIVEEKLRKYRFYKRPTLALLNPKWREPEAYWFSPLTGEVYVTALFINLTDEDILDFVNKANNFISIAREINNIHHKIFKKFKLTKNIHNGKMYSFEKKEIHEDMSFDSDDFKEMISVMEKARDDILAFDENNIIPETEYNFLQRYYFIKHDEYQLNGDNYVIYKFKGIRNRNFYRGFKNGTKLSTHQLVRAYKKRKQQAS